MSLSADRLLKLVTAIENDQLVFLCGAGLSMPDPSYLPSAWAVAKACYDKRTPIEALDPALRDDVDKLAAFFHARGDFADTFIPLVPWHDLAGEPNDGHAAVADFLISRAALGVLSANFDTMIERWAEHRKVVMAGALTGQEAINFASISNPLVKFHGCMNRDRDNTLWTQGQLNDAAVKQRVESCSDWMKLNLPGKHLVVVGFWTDWGYLNSVLASAFTVKNAASVTVVDTTDTDTLKSKAPDLWTKLNELSGSFEHVQASGCAVLDQLRIAFSRAWLKKFYALSQAAAQAMGIDAIPSPDGLEIDALYDLRRDVEGVSYACAASAKAPPTSAGLAALAHISLIASGALQTGAFLQHGARRVRVVNGSGKTVQASREEHKEPSSLPQPDLVVCAGGYDLGVPARVISKGKGASVVSPTPGGSVAWVTWEDAKGVLGL